MNVALVTNEEFPNLIDGEVRFFEALRSRGVNVSCAVWSDPTVKWSKYTHVILRLCWDYHLRLDEFLDWVSRLEKVKINVFNDTEVIRWNTNKSYLLDLEERGVAIPVTQIVSSENLSDVSDIIQAFDSKVLIVKPAVGAAAYKVRKFARDDPKMVTYIKQLLKHSDVLMQEFIPEIANGEISASFFGNQLSHVVIKIPQVDDFRSNHGGHIESYEPDQNMKQRLVDTYAKCGVDTLHARLDVIDTGDELVLIELELIDAELFMEYDEGSADRLVDAFLAQESSSDKPRR